MTIRDLYGELKAYLLNSQEDLSELAGEVLLVMFWDTNWLDAGFLALLIAVSIWLIMLRWMWTSTESIALCLPEDKRKSHLLTRYGTYFALTLWWACIWIVSEYVLHGMSRSLLGSMGIYLICIYTIQYALYFIYDGKSEESDWLK